MWKIKRESLVIAEETKCFITVGVKSVDEAIIQVPNGLLVIVMLKFSVNNTTTKLPLNHFLCYIYYSLLTIISHPLPLTQDNFKVQCLTIFWMEARALSTSSCSTQKTLTLSMPR